MSDTSWGRLVGVLVAPEKTFRSVGERPTWAVALIVLVAVGVLASSLAAPRIDWEDLMRTRMEQADREVPEENMDQIVETMEKVGPWLAIGGAAVAPPIAYLLSAASFWVLINVLGGMVTFLRSWSITLHGLMPQAVSSLLAVPVILGSTELDAERLQSGSILVSNLATLAPEGSGPALTALLASCDVFTVWTVVLLAIGFEAGAGVSRGKAWGTVIGCWLVWIGIKVGLAALGG